jgi:hypothetical protein
MVDGFFWQEKAEEYLRHVHRREGRKKVLALQSERRLPQFLQLHAPERMSHRFRIHGRRQNPTTRGF